MDPLRASLVEQLTRLRGDGSELPEALLDVVREEVLGFTVLRPREWDELRHQYGGAGMTAPYWASAWPSGLALAEMLLEGPELEGVRVLELGCGLGIPSLVAARRGAAVTVTDSSPDAVVFAAHNLAINELEGEAALADWREPRALLDGAPWDLVLGADVLYLQDNVDALLRLLPGLIGDAGEAVLTDPSRAGGRDFAAAARSIFDLETRPGVDATNVNVHRIRPRGASGASLIRHNGSKPVAVGD